MKIEFSSAEIEKILLDYANKMVEGYGFNHVKGSNYRDLPPSIELTKEVKDEHTSTE
jgi:hypothetical protein